MQKLPGAPAPETFEVDVVPLVALFVACALAYALYRASNRDRVIIGALTLTALVLALRRRFARSDDAPKPITLEPKPDDTTRGNQDATTHSIDDAIDDATRGESDDSRALRAWANARHNDDHT